MVRTCGVLGWVWLLAASYAHAQVAATFWLNLDPANGGRAERLDAAIDLFPAGTAPQRLYLWAALTGPSGPTGDLTSVGLNLRAESIGANSLLDLTQVELDNPPLANDGGVTTYRHQFVIDSSVDSFSPCAESSTGPVCLAIEPVTVPPHDFLDGFGGISVDSLFDGRIAVGIGDQARTYEDRSFDGVNWRIGWIEFTPLEEGTVKLFLQVGRPGINIFGAAKPTPVHFGSLNEATVLGDSYFAESLEEEALLTIRLMPDYNLNNTVDAADYTVWRNTLGSTSDLRADGDSNQVIDTADFDRWKSLYGRSNVAVAGLATNVPEPSTGSILVYLALVHVFIGLTLRRR